MRREGHADVTRAPPTFDRVTLHVDPAKKVDFVIDAKGAGAAPYVQSATLGGKPLTQARFAYADVVAGKTLTLTMGAAPGSWATAPVCPSLHASRASRQRTTIARILSARSTL